MRVLFDHNLPHKLRTQLGTLSQHEIVTTSYMGWRKLKNGELLQNAEEGGFDVFVTGDQTLIHEQHLAGRCLAIVTLSAVNWPIIKDFVQEILTFIERAVPGSVTTECVCLVGSKLVNGSSSLIRIVCLCVSSC